MSELVNNAEQEWDNFNTGQYYKQYTSEMLLDDRYITAETVIGLYAFCLANNVKPASFEHGADYGNGGSPLSASFIAPLVRNRPGTLSWVDLGQPQLAAARKNIQAGQERELDPWLHHQEYMGSIHPLWSSALYYAADIGTAVKGDGFNPEPNSTSVGKCSYFHESATAQKGEWREGTMSFFRSVEPDGLVLDQYMIGSTGYTSAAEEYRSVEIYPEDMLELAEQELTQVQHYAYYKSRDAVHSARPEDDRHDYVGMGVLIGKRRNSTTIIV
jgi:hypothetical protein